MMLANPNSKECHALCAAFVSKEHESGEDCTVTEVEQGPEYLKIFYFNSNPYKNGPKLCVTTLSEVLVWAWYNPRKMP